MLDADSMVEGVAVVILVLTVESNGMGIELAPAKGSIPFNRNKPTRVRPLLVRNGCSR
jgi:hypothetical protein